MDSSREHRVKALDLEVGTGQVLLVWPTPPLSSLFYHFPRSSHVFHLSLSPCALSDLRFSFVTIHLAQVKTTVRVSPITLSLSLACSPSLFRSRSPSSSLFFFAGARLFVVVKRSHESSIEIGKKQLGKRNISHTWVSR